MNGGAVAISHEKKYVKEGIWSEKFLFTLGQLFIQIFRLYSFWGPIHQPFNFFSQ